MNALRQEASREFHADKTQPTFAQMKRFLVKRYKHDRLYGRSGREWFGGGNTYGDLIVNGRLRDLAEHGIDLISSNESGTGKVVWYKFENGKLREIDCALASAALRQRPRWIAATVAS